MLRLSALLLLLFSGAAVAADYPVNGTVIAEQNIFDGKEIARANIIGRIGAGTPVVVTECFDLSCHVADGWISAANIMLGTGTTAMEYKQALHFKANPELLTDPGPQLTDVVLWGDSLSTDELGQVLRRLLPGRLVSAQGVLGENGAQIAVRMLADTKYAGRFKVIWDRHYPSQKPQAYLNDLAPMIERAKATGDFIIVSDIRQLLPGADVPDPAADATLTTAINQQLAKLYPANFIDVTALLEDPKTRYSDGLHLSATGNARVAKALANAIETRTAMAAQ